MCEKYLKGDKIYVEGPSRQWQTEDGTVKIHTEIQSSLPFVNQKRYENNKQI
jgi:single-stranded DNA-binding protein